MLFKKAIPYSDLFAETGKHDLTECDICYAPVTEQLWLYAIKERLAQIPFKYCQMGTLTGIDFVFQVTYGFGDEKYAWSDIQECAALFRKTKEFQKGHCFVGTAKNHPHKGMHELLLFVPNAVSAENVATLFRKLYPIYLHCSGNDDENNIPSDENLTWKAEIERNLIDDFGVQFAKYNQKEGAVLNLGCLKNADTEAETNQKIQEIKRQIDEEMSIGGVISIIDTGEKDKSFVRVFVPMTFTSQEAANLFNCAYRIAKEIIEE